MKFNVQKYVEDPTFTEAMLRLMEDTGRAVFGKEYAPDIPTILQLWRADVFKLVTMIDEENKLVGFSAWVCSKKLFTAGTQAVCITIFLAPSLRGSTALEDMLEYGQSAMRILGFDEVVISVDESHAKLKAHLLAKQSKTGGPYIVQHAAQYKFGV